MEEFWIGGAGRRIIGQGQVLWTMMATGALLLALYVIAFYLTVAVERYDNMLFYDYPNSISVHEIISEDVARHYFHNKSSNFPYGELFSLVERVDCWFRGFPWGEPMPEHQTRSVP